jgi:hypothetical protein
MPRQTRQHGSFPTAAPSHAEGRRRKLQHLDGAAARFVPVITVRRVWPRYKISLSAGALHLMKNSLWLGRAGGLSAATRRKELATGKIPSLSNRLTTIISTEKYFHAVTVATKWSPAGLQTTTD